MTDPESYSIAVKRVPVDGELLFRATVNELPHIAEYAETHAEAYELAVDAIRTLQETSRELGQHFPPPMEEETEFSGRVTLRMPRALHRQISTQADREGVSLNQYLVSVIGYAAAAGGSFFRETASTSDYVAVATDQTATTVGNDVARSLKWLVSRHIVSVQALNAEENLSKVLVGKTRLYSTSQVQLATKVSRDEEVRKYN